MNYFKTLSVIALVVTLLTTTSCSSHKLNVASVGYQSVRTEFARPEKIPAESKIVATYFINAAGEVLVVVKNLSDKIMTIDQTKSFLINTDGQSMSYYDPTVRSTTQGNFNAETKSASFNLGAISNIFGVGKVLGSLLDATTLGSSSSTGAFGSQTVTVVDQPLLHVGPYGTMVLSKQFKIQGVGRSDLKNTSGNFIDTQAKFSPYKFSVCIYYSLEDEQPQKLVTPFYVSSKIVEPVSKGRVNNAFRRIYSKKSDALAEPNFIIHINTNLEKIDKVTSFGDELYYDNILTSYNYGFLIDFQ